MAKATASVRGRTEEALEVLEKAANELASSRKIQTEEGRHIVNLIQRLIEVQRYGTTKTLPISTHNG